MTLTDKQMEKRLITSNKYLKKIGEMIGMYGKLKKTPPEMTEENKYECLGAVAVVTSSNAPISARMACSLILDYWIPNWREIIGKENLGYVIDRNSKEVRHWRKAVLKRDEHKCVRCGNEDNLEVHHIAQWSDYPELRLEVDNGETLCNNCHAKEHEEFSGLILSRVG